MSTWQHTGCVFLLLLVTCGQPETPQRLATPGEQPRDGGTLVRRLTEDLQSSTPVCAPGSDDHYVHQYVFTPLLYLDRELRVIPGIATHWEQRDDGRTFRFSLQPAATFSDKTPVRARDVLFSLQQARTARHLAGSFEFVDEQRTRVIDDHTVDIAFTHSLATQLSRFADLYIIPAHIYERAPVCETDQMIGSGPYRLAVRHRGQSITLERRNDYWGQRPHIHRIQFRVITEHAQAWNALKTGQLDEARVTAAVWEHERTAYGTYFTFRPYYQPSYNFIAWNGRHEFLRDARLRRALAQAIDVDRIIDAVYLGTARRLTGPFVPDEEAYNAMVPPIRYDPDGARQLLATAGWHDSNGDGILEKQGHQLVFSLLIASEGDRTLAQLLQSSWESVGAHVEIEQTDGTTASARLLARNYDAAYWAWSLDADPDLYSIFHSSQVPPAGYNFVSYRNSRVDRLIEDARTERDAAKRRALHRELHMILAAEQPYTWLVQPATKWVAHRRIQGVELSPRIGPFGWYPGELAWWLAPTSTERVP